ncbi:helix-turn-helix domain-containing protein [Corynebacterium auriscanis]|uniref:helix-turn-helix domain-containing protein n=1 Tax=Corynebacterium TaxID=1716 RepID=UPI0008A504E9|nr:helix-turn-helix domain-containing protein [Corynebacterium sp. HMSC28B08]OFT88984.1 hypothetical protein HMPREF3098_06725 [Corynebacterium sp. HMSC28B08]
MKITRQRARFLMDSVEDSIGERHAMLTISQFAQIAGKDRMTIWDRCARGELPAVQERKGAQYRIHYHQLDSYITPEVAA